MRLKTTLYCHCYYGLWLPLKQRGKHFLKSVLGSWATAKSMQQCRNNAANTFEEKENEEMCVCVYVGGAEGSLFHSWDLRKSFQKKGIQSQNKRREQWCAERISWTVGASISFGAWWKIYWWRKELPVRRVLIYWQFLKKAIVQNNKAWQNGTGKILLKSFFKKGK